MYNVRWSSQLNFGVIWPRALLIHTIPLARNSLAWHLSNMADHPGIKPDARQLVDALPESATWDDLAYEVYVRQAVETGLADAEEGRTIAHEDAMARVRNRIRRAS